MILEFELEERTGNSKFASYTILRKGLPVGSFILNPEYQQLLLKTLTINTEKKANK